MTGVAVQTEIADDNYEELSAYSEKLASGGRRCQVSVPDIRCGSCVAQIEQALGRLTGVTAVRANLTRKRVTFDCCSVLEVQRALRALQDLGYSASFVNDTESAASSALGKRYLRATAVAGFAAGNIMMLSVAVWAGADGMTRFFFHSLSAVLAIAAVSYAGSIFFASAWSALKVGRTNMDVPISVGIILSMALGIYDTVQGGSDVYFEAATMLIFFLLVGRTLEHNMRERAASSLGALARIAPRTTLLLDDKGASSTTTPTTSVAVESVQVGDVLLIPPHTRVPVDAMVVVGESEFDTSIVDGESKPKLLAVGEMLDAGIKNTENPVVVKACKTHQHSFLSRTQRMVETVSYKKGRYQTLSERVARWYAPVVHCAALAAGLFWYLNGADFHRAVTIAVSVLIITCPCALGLAVPMVQVLAGGKLFKHGVVMKNGSALERLSEVDTVIFDKTGTLTEKTASVTSEGTLPALETSVLYSLAKQSNHPFARSIVKNIMQAQTEGCDKTFEIPDVELTNVQEHPGQGIEGDLGDVRYRLGKINWVENTIEAYSAERTNTMSGFSANGTLIHRYGFEERLRSDARLSVRSLSENNCQLFIASGDQDTRVRAIANALGIETAYSNASPAEKSEQVKQIKANGHCVAMVGDGINDTVALAAADVSIAMGDAGDIGANRADFILLHNKLVSINRTRQLAKAAKKLVQQNMSIAIAYNVLAMPLAFAGWVSPLVAAISMSTSSLLVVGNSLRLNRQSIDIDCAITTDSPNDTVFPPMIEAGKA